MEKLPALHFRTSTRTLDIDILYVLHVLYVLYVRHALRILYVLRNGLLLREQDKLVWIHRTKWRPSTRGLSKFHNTTTICISQEKNQPQKS